MLNKIFVGLLAFVTSMFVFAAAACLPTAVIVLFTWIFWGSAVSQTVFFVFLGLIITMSIVFGGAAALSYEDRG